MGWGWRPKGEELSSGSVVLDQAGFARKWVLTKGPNGYETYSIGLVNETHTHPMRI